MKGSINSIIQSNIPVLIDFFAEWCGPCKAQAPILVELAKTYEGKIKVIKIDIDKNPEIANRFQIRSVPTLSLFKDGQNIWKQSGMMDKGSLTRIIQSYI